MEKSANLQELKQFTKTDPTVYQSLTYGNVNDACRRGFFVSLDKRRSIQIREPLHKS